MSHSKRVWTWLMTAAALAIGAAIAAEKPADQAAMSGHKKISFYKEIRPIFQANCMGCHQPAKANGKYVMTDFAKLIAGGDSEKKAITPGKIEASELVKLITPENGQAEMPEGKKPLHETEIELIKKWIAQGAADDTPENARQRYDQQHPPIYTRPPVITSIDYSPDGKLMAVSGFHEVLLSDAATGKLAGRLIGLSERVESVRFSPDGKLLAVSGGLPCRTGEIQIWDVSTKKLKMSVPVTYDTLYGISWSPDGKLLGFGCADKTVRAIDASSGEQVLFSNTHDDWALDTVFTPDGKNLVSVGRDGAVKLIEVETQRFIDNITSITPGALKGGVNSVARHPTRQEIVIGGSDGVPKVYRVFRQTPRKIGDDACLIRRMPQMMGRIFSVAVSPDGKRIAASSSLDGKGEVHVFSYEFDTDLPEEIKQIVSKVASTASAEEKQKLEAYLTKDVKIVSKLEVAEAGVYAIAFSPDSKTLAAAGADGVVRLIDPETGSVLKKFAPAPKATQAAIAAASQAEHLPFPELPLEAESLPEGAKITALAIQPAQITLGHQYDNAQLIVTATLAGGDAVDVTRMASFAFNQPVALVSRRGVVHPIADGAGELKIELQGQSASIPVTVQGMERPYRPDYIRDIAPVMARLGCNQGTCHGAAKGKNGFKLSLRGYDAVFDIRALTDDHASRRVAGASPDDSLMLLKPTGAAPHEGGVLMNPGEPYYELLRNWIADGSKLNPATPRVTRIAISPIDPVVQQVGSRQQFRIMATYADGRVRDVTQEAFIETGNQEVATVDRHGLASTLRRGEAPLLARFEGAYAATTLTVMGDRTGFTWTQPPAFNPVDELVAAKWKRMKIQPSELCSDSDFIRRVYLDLTGLPPTSDQVRAFLNDSGENRAKREKLVDQLVGSREYVDHWTNKWADLLQVNRKFLNPEGATAFRQWIRQQVDKNTPYDQFAYSILTATGSNRENPAASYYKILRDPTAMMENTTHLFLAVRFNCNKCHDHPFERWTQDQYYQTSAYFAQVELKRDPESGAKNIGGTAVEGAKPLYEIVVDKTDGDIQHDRTGHVAAPIFPYNAEFNEPAKPTRRAELASWITSADNQYFARSYVNRLWGYLFGVGIIDPIDDIRAGNPPSNPQLLDYLTQEFIAGKFDVRRMLKLIAKSRAYQLSYVANQWNRDDKINYSHAIPRRLPAEVLYDSIQRVTGSVSKLPGVAPGARAAELPDSGVDLPSGFFVTFGRPARESACECERTAGVNLGPVMALVSGPVVGEAVGDAKSELTKLVASEKDDRKLIDAIFLRVLNRPAADKEIDAVLQSMRRVGEDDVKLRTELAAREAAWAPIFAQKEKERQAAIAKAQAELSEYEKGVGQKIAQAEEERKQKIAADEKALNQYAAALAKKRGEWEKSLAVSDNTTLWSMLEITEANATGASAISLEKQPDGSWYAKGSSGSVNYRLAGSTQLAGVTGIMLEVLPDERLPRFGPGRAGDGNFVLTELDVTAMPMAAGAPAAKAAAKASPKQAAKKARKAPAGAVPVAFSRAKADFSQKKFDVKTAIDGKRDQGAANGWAISNQQGQRHLAVFQFAKPVGDEQGATFTLNLAQIFREGYNLGRFRIWVTHSKAPLDFGRPAPVVAALKTPADQRTKEQSAALTAYQRLIDTPYLKREQALWTSRKPLPVDPKLLALREAVADAKLPVPVEPRLAQLRDDVKMSKQQATDARLTAAQDLAWALINSPAFLFNH